LAERVDGIGGVFFRSPDPDALRAWHSHHLGIEVLEHVEEHEYGRFAWAVDPEGHRLELWEPPT
jgi:predicted enzyme related to lactoylglutathione lyase